MNIEAMKQMVRVLSTVRDTPLLAQKFNLSDWLERKFDNDNNSYTTNTAKAFAEVKDDKDFILIPHNCGTSACACGYAGLDAWFRAQNFKTDKNGNIYFGEFDSWDAVHEFFDINEETAANLFSGDSYISEEDEDDEESSYENLVAKVTPQMVIDRIEALIATEA